MPLFNPIISNVVPQKVGGSASAGNSLLASADDHVHPLTETSGPTNMSVGAIYTGEVWSRSAGNVIGKRIYASSKTAALSTTSTTLQTIGSIALPRAGTYSFELLALASGAAAVGLQMGFNYTGTTSDRRIVMYRPETSGTRMLWDTNVFNSKFGSANEGWSDGLDHFLHAWGYFVATAPGTFSLQYCSGVSGSAVTLNTGTKWSILEEG